MAQLVAAGAGPRTFEPGDRLAVECDDEPGTFHARLVLRAARPEALRAVMEMDIFDEQKVYWILTPDGDIYPEELNVPPLSAYCQCDKAGRLRRHSGMTPAGRRCCRHFALGEGAVERLTPMVARHAMAVAEREDNRYRGGGSFDLAGVIVPVVGSAATAAPTRAAAAEEEDTEETDARVLVVARGPSGVRSRHFRETEPPTEQRLGASVAVPDSELDGPAGARSPTGEVAAGTPGEGMLLDSDDESDWLGDDPSRWDPLYNGYPTPEESEEESAGGSATEDGAAAATYNESGATGSPPRRVLVSARPLSASSSDSDAEIDALVEQIYGSRSSGSAGHRVGQEAAQHVRRVAPTGDHQNGLWLGGAWYESEMHYLMARQALPHAKRARVGVQLGDAIPGVVPLLHDDGRRGRGSGEPGGVDLTDQVAELVSESTPLREEYVADELGEETAAAKERRHLREERSGGPPRPLPEK